MFTFSDKYILKSMWEMVRDEGNRIVSLGLATHEDLKKFIKPAVQAATKEAGSGDEALLIALGKLYNDLKSVYLQGDFEKLSTASEWEAYLLEADDEDDEDEDEEKEKEDEEEEEEKEDDLKEAPPTPEATGGAEEAVEKDLAVPEQGLVTIYSILEEMAYKRGRVGDHEGAYKIERTIRSIERIASSLDKEDIEKMAAEIQEALGEEGEESPFEERAQPIGEPTIAVNEFVKRQTPESKYSHFGGSWDQLVQLVKQNFNKAMPGYRDGVLQVPVPPEGFYTSIAELTPGAEIAAKYEARREGEDPYMQLTMPGGQKIPAKSVNIILYRHDVLAEGNENSTDADWEIISINASSWEGAEGESEPLMPEALMRNYFGEPGGTEMKGVSPEQFVEMLRKSRDYWRNKIMLG